MGRAARARAASGLGRLGTEPHVERGSVDDEGETELEQGAREAAEAKRENEERAAKDRQQSHPKELDPMPKEKAQKNSTDPDSRMRRQSGSKDAFIQGYNCRAAGGGKDQTIVLLRAAVDRLRRITRTNS